jgi:hypothetical protein
MTVVSGSMPTSVRNGDHLPESHQCSPANRALDDTLSEEFADAIAQSRLSAVAGKGLQWCVKPAILNEIAPSDANLLQRRGWNHWCERC